jgi:hypothetical protein
MKASISRLDRGDCLLGSVDALTKLSLRHFAVEETKDADPVRNRSVHHACLR